MPTGGVGALELFLGGFSRFCETIGTIKKPEAVVIALQNFSLKYQGLRVLGIWYVPAIYTDFDAWVPHKSTFVHPELSDPYIDGYLTRLRQHGGSALGILARSRSAPFTFTEARRLIQPSGQYNWPFEYMRSFGIRDGLYVPNRVWNTAYRSSKVLDISKTARHLLGAAATVAVGRIEQLVKSPTRFEKPRAKLSERETAIMSLISWGKTTEEIAAQLEISMATVREHISNAIHRLGAIDRAHAVAVAIRQGLLSGEDDGRRGSKQRRSSLRAGRSGLASSK